MRLIPFCGAFQKPKRAPVRTVVRLADLSAESEDLGTVVELVGAFAKEAYALEAETERLRALLPSFTSGFTFLAEETRGDQRVACGYALCLMKMNSFSGCLVLELHDIFVVPDFRHAGVGQMLMDAVVAAAKERGCLKLELNTHELNANARAFYEIRNGFECYDNYLVRGGGAPIKGRSLMYSKKLT